MRPAGKIILLEPREFRLLEQLDELRMLAASSDASQKARAAHDAEDEAPDIFNDATGFDLAKAPRTFALLQRVAKEEDADTKLAKRYFHRLRPYSVDPTLKTCEPTKPGKAANSYPSGHATLAFSMDVVLANLLPEKAQPIPARASEYAENRLVCGVHYRGDIVAGQQFGTVLALSLMQVPNFTKAMDAARAELKATNSSPN